MIELKFSQRAETELRRKLNFERQLKPELSAFFGKQMRTFVRTYGLTRQIPFMEDDVAELAGILFEHYTIVANLFAFRMRKEMPANLAMTEAEGIEVNGILLERFDKQSTDQARTIVRTSAKEMQISIAKAIQIEADALSSGKSISRFNTATTAGQILIMRAPARVARIACYETQWSAELSKQVEVMVLTGDTFELKARDSRGKFKKKAIKQWDTVGDSRVRDHHLVVDGQQVDANKPFTVNRESLMYPGDTSLGASANNVINCRCSSVADVKSVIGARQDLQSFVPTDQLPRVQLPGQPLFAGTVEAAAVNPFDEAARIINTSIKHPKRLDRFRLGPGGDIDEAAVLREVARILDGTTRLRPAELSTFKKAFRPVINAAKRGPVKPPPVVRPPPKPVVRPPPRPPPPTPPVIDPVITNTPGMIDALAASSGRIATIIKNPKRIARFIGDDLAVIQEVQKIITGTSRLTAAELQTFKRAYKPVIDLLSRGRLPPRTLRPPARTPTRTTRIAARNIKPPAAGTEALENTADEAMRRAAREMESVGIGPKSTLHEFMSGLKQLNMAEGNALSTQEALSLVRGVGNVRFSGSKTRMRELAEFLTGTNRKLYQSRAINEVRWVKQGRRAWAQEQRNVINVGRGEVDTLAHEFGHHIEFRNRKLRQRFVDWRSARRNSDDILRGPTSINGRRTEIGFKDEWMEQYMGRTYSSTPGDAFDSTELLSMGMETLAGGGARYSSKTLYQRMITEDPEYLQMMWSVLRGY